jgi:hypothetical protein
MALDPINRILAIVNELGASQAQKRDVERQLAMLQAQLPNTKTAIVKTNAFQGMKL